MLLKDFIRQTCESLEAVYPAQEARSIVSIYCADVLGVQSYTHIVNPSTEIPGPMLARVLADAADLSKGRPLQQVLGYAWFCERKFKVTPDVLIPRPETEMLVKLALEGLTDGAKVLDLCTGSGCIAWTLSLDAPGAYVTAVDISGKALDVAASQFDGRAPLFVEADILDPEWWKRSEGMEEGSFDMILSNPPYIMESEKSDMRKNVLDFEPELALFVPDSDPLLFYKAIAHTARALLKRGGRGIVEINEALGKETVSVFKAAGMSDIKIIKDCYGKDRSIEFIRH